MSIRWRFIGIDPGFTGAVGEWGGESKYVEDFGEVWDMPVQKQGASLRIARDVLRNKLHLIQTTLDKDESLVAVVEAVNAMPKFGQDPISGTRFKRQEGAASMFAFGQGQGEVLGILSGLGITTFEVPATVWVVQAGLSGLSDRERCKRAAHYFPMCADQFFGPKGGPKHGRADAMFLAAHARKIATGKGLEVYRAG